MSQRLKLHLLWGIALAGCLLTVPAALLAGPPAAPGQITLVLAAPWNAHGGPEGIVHALSGQVVTPRSAPLATLAVLDDPAAARDLGAWIVADGRLLARLCGIGV